MKSKLKKIALSILPKCSIFDSLYNYLYFVYCHRRIPRPRNKTFLDQIFRIKTTKEALNPLRVLTSDKELVKHYVSHMVGDRFNIPTYKVLLSPSDVDNYNFPKRCVIKPTHASGEIILRESGEWIDKDIIKSWFELDYYAISREVNYKYLIKKVIVEPFVYDKIDVEDIKFFVYCGVVKLIQVDFDRRKFHTRRLYDRNWNDLNTSIGFPLSSRSFDKPTNLKEMISSVESLSVPFDLVRVDLYTDGKSFFIGEITHVHGSGGERFYPADNEDLINKIIFE